MRFHIETFGCQMNVLDSELATAALIGAGFEPATEKGEADVLLFNTCSIRQHAEDKVYSALGRLKHLKTQRPGTIIAVMGCMAQKEKGIIFRRAPHVDLVLGPGQLERLPDLIRRLQEGEKNPGMPSRLLEISLDRFDGRKHAHSDIKDSFKQFDPLRLGLARQNTFQAMLRIMFGCDKFCSYCIVPGVRGPEQCRPPQEIIEEAKRLVDQGVLEITLIGQTVNSYQWKEGDRTTELADLLEAVHEIDGLRRLRFLTNYPRGMSDRLLDAVRVLPKVAPFLHVPAQSGSSAVLKRMRRHYTAEEYRELLDRMNEKVPDASITSDFIVGFCGETEEEFQETVELVRHGRFKNSFIFKYSERKGTRAADEMPDDVPEETKRRRNNELLKEQNAISLELNRLWVGRRAEILVEGETGKPGRLSGRTGCDRIVVFEGDRSLIGTFVKVQILGAAPFTLFGKILAFSKKNESRIQPFYT